LATVLGMNGGGRALVAGNTFLMNRHSVAGDGEAHDSYRASLNLVLSSSPAYDLGFAVYHGFDMHGVGDNGFGGIAGNYMDIGINHHNFMLRGYPCLNTDFHSNIVRQAEDDAVIFKPSDPTIHTSDFPINVFYNSFGSSDPTDHLGTGDFDGDSLTDVFLATGAAWYYSPGANAEGRFLCAKTDTLDHLLFGDFDGDRVQM
jgi:hypothetical protein